MFPGPGAIVYRNEAGEVTGWDNPGDPLDLYCDQCGACHAGPCTAYDDDDS